MMGPLVPLVAQFRAATAWSSDGPSHTAG